jgi:beta-glucosidase
MAQATYHFPRGFLWGTATAAHQVEGSCTNNNWYAWEQQSGRIKLGHKSSPGCDWWGGRWREDLDRAAEGHQNAHRFSIEWSRIQPVPDKWDETALDRYREMARGMTDRGMMPLVTLHHFSDPLWLVEKGGWENEETPEIFARFVRKAVDALREYVTMWVPINEPNVYAFSGYMTGDFPPGKRDFNTALRVMANLARGHALAYKVIHEIQPESRVGAAINVRGALPSTTWSPLDKWAARLVSGLFNDYFPHAFHTGQLRTPFSRRSLPELKGTQDFLGINYYTEDLVSFDPLHATEIVARRYYDKAALLSETGFLANRPEGFFRAFEWGRQFGVPMLVTENGVEDSKDTLRPRYLVEHIYQMWRAVNFNYPIKGYFHWSLLDNFEWERGWTQRFGLWELDTETLARRKRPSADLYAEICKENGLSSEMVARYVPEVFEQLFPN